MILSKLKTFQILRTLSSYIYIKQKEKKSPLPISQFYNNKKSLVYLFYKGITKILKWYYGSDYLQLPCQNRSVNQWSVDVFWIVDNVNVNDKVYCLYDCHDVTAHDVLTTTLQIDGHRTWHHDNYIRNQGNKIRALMLLL